MSFHIQRFWNYDITRLSDPSQTRNRDLHRFAYIQSDNGGSRVIGTLPTCLKSSCINCDTYKIRHCFTSSCIRCLSDTCRGVVLKSSCIAVVMVWTAPCRADAHA